MAGLVISGDFLDSLEGQLKQIATLVTVSGASNTGHSGSGSAAVTQAGDEATAVQSGRSDVAAQTASTLAQHSQLVATTMDEADGQLATDANGGSSGHGASGKGGGGGGGSGW